MSLEPVTMKLEMTQRPAWVFVFLKVLRKDGNVSHACTIAEVERQTAYERREKDRWFGQEWDRLVREHRDEEQRRRISLYYPPVRRRRR